ncbi:transcription factor protein isoform X1 [Ciona intestinalis]
MDISLDQALEQSEKHQDDLDDDSSELMQDVNVGEGLVTEDSEVGEVQGQEGLQTYQFRSGDNGQVTYRVVQVGSEDNQQATLSIVTTNGIHNMLNQDAGGSGSPQQVAIVTNPFNGDAEGAGQSGDSDNSSAKFAYFSSGNPGNTQEIASGSESQDPQNVTGGQFYVMMSPQDMLQSNQVGRSLAPRNHFVQKVDNSRSGGLVVRDTTRRVQHNEVERRRRDRINNWIMKLSKLVPDCQGDHTKQGQSKGGILSKTCEYILDLQSSNQRLSDRTKGYERIQLDYEVLRVQMEEKKQENNILRQMLQSHGIEVAITNTSNNNQNQQQ